ncbi:MAG: DUF4258 domain-containing protein [Blastocatellia bacterium]|nr:DUF4258 domain-containing protein [Blastocatellia bacterium]
MDIEIETIHERINRGDYFILSHAVTHGLKEGFAPCDIVTAVLNGKIIEQYPAAQRVLVCGRVELMPNVSIYLHVVCECADPFSVALVTAYVPDEKQWETPPSARRRKSRK